MGRVRPDDATESPELRAEVEQLSAERLIFFSDAVVAIAITLLALDLPVPTGAGNREVLSSAADHLGEYFAFIISFLVIASHWRGHHRVFRYVKQATHVVGWNLVWLFGIVITPFATRVLTGDEGFQVRFTFYAVVQAMTGLSFVMVLRAVGRYRLLRPGSPRRLVRDSSVQLLGMASMFVVSIPVCFVTHWAYACWVAIPLATWGMTRAADRFFPDAGVVSAG